MAWPARRDSSRPPRCWPVAARRSFPAPAPRHRPAALGPTSARPPARWPAARPPPWLSTRTRVPAAAPAPGAGPGDCWCEPNPSTLIVTHRAGSGQLPASCRRVATPFYRGIACLRDNCQAIPAPDRSRASAQPPRPARGGRRNFEGERNLRTGGGTTPNSIATVTLGGFTIQGNGWPLSRVCGQLALPGLTRSRRGRTWSCPTARCEGARRQTRRPTAARAASAIQGAAVRHVRHDWRTSVPSGGTR